MKRFRCDVVREDERRNQSVAHDYDPAIVQYDLNGVFPYHQPLSLRSVPYRTLTVDISLNSRHDPPSLTCCYTPAPAEFHEVDWPKQVDKLDKLREGGMPPRKNAAPPSASVVLAQDPRR